MPWTAQRVVEVDEKLLFAGSPHHNTETSVTWTVIKENRK